MLYSKDRPGEDLVVRGARVLDPVEGIDAVVDVRIDAGTIAAIGEHLDTNEHRVVDGKGLVLAPAFVDPHVHLRTPGREDEETIASGTQAAAAGGFCAILAMPNTDPVVDSAATLGALVEAAGRDAEVAVGFLAAITRGQRGDELTEMAELADAGAVAFSDDGVPVASAGMMRRALQYSSITGRKLALHCEERSLSHDGHVHEGSVAAELGFTGYPSVAESVMVERDLALAAYEAQPIHRAGYQRHPRCDWPQAGALDERRHLGRALHKRLLSRARIRSSRANHASGGRAHACSGRCDAHRRLPRDPGAVFP